jgi:hypothetical protein
MLYALSFFMLVLMFSFVLRANAQQPKLFVVMILILIFPEALALYDIIVGIILFLLLFKCIVLLLAFVLVSYLKHVHTLLATLVAWSYGDNDLVNK